MGRAVYSMMKDSEEVNGNIVAFTLDPSRVTAGVLSGAPVVFGDGGRYDLYKAAGVKKPRAVLISYGSRTRRMDVLRRIRQTLPPETLIYARADNQLEYQELIDAGADEVISESTEAVVRFANILDVFKSPMEADILRKRLLTAGPMSMEGESSTQTIPGYSDSYLSDLVEELGISRKNLIKLRDIFESFDGFDGKDVPITELRDFLARNSDYEPIDTEALTRCMKLVDEDGEGDLSFEEFVRISCLRSV